MRGAPPSRRSGHSLTVVGDRAFLFGGVDDSKPVGPNNQLHVLRMSGACGTGPAAPSARGPDLGARATGDMSWESVNITGEPPGARWKHSACVLERTHLLIFGGFKNDTTRWRDVWQLDLKLRSWTCLHSGTRDADRAKRGRPATKG